MIKKQTIFSIQMLRAIASIMVVIAHAQVHLHVRKHIPELDPFLDIGRTGVDLFFIISGFIMVFISGNNFSIKGAPLDFAIKRIIRVVPIYWIYTLSLATLMLLLPQLVSQGKTVEIQHLIASLFFIPWENTVGSVKPVLSVGWTLNFEMYFYLVFSILLIFPKKYFLPLLSIILLSGVLANTVFKPLPTTMHVMSSNLLIEFLMGCFIGTLYTSKFTLSKQLSYLCIIIGLVGLFLTATEYAISAPRFIRWGVPSAFLVIGIIFLEKTDNIKISRLLVTLGDSSYSLYLTHIFTINALGKIWVTLFQGYYMLFILAAVIISPIVGHIAYLIVEKPIIQYLNTRHKNYKLRKQN